jgi:hypothetical protein
MTLQLTNASQMLMAGNQRTCHAQMSGEKAPIASQQARCEREWRLILHGAVGMCAHGLEAEQRQQWPPPPNAMGANDAAVGRSKDQAAGRCLN